MLSDFCTASFLHNNIDEALDVPQFVAIKVHQQHAGANNGGTELNAGLGFLFGIHSSNPARIISQKIRDELSVFCSCIQISVDMVVASIVQLWFRLWWSITLQITEKRWALP